LPAREPRPLSTCGSALRSPSNSTPHVDLAEPLAEHLRALRSRLREEAFRRCESFDERSRVCCPGLPDQPTEDRSHNR
jgi:hypothetical protein